VGFALLSKNYSRLLDGIKLKVCPWFGEPQSKDALADSVFHVVFTQGVKKLRMIAAGLGTQRRQIAGVSGLQ
jgi:hypothetical protein